MTHWLSGLLAAVLTVGLCCGCGGPDKKKAAEEQAALEALLDRYEQLLETHGQQVNEAATEEALEDAKAGLVKAVEEWIADWGKQLGQTANLSESQIAVLRERAMELKTRAQEILARDLKAEDAAADADAPATRE